MNNSIIEAECENIDPLALVEYRRQSLLINFFFEIVDTVKDLIKIRFFTKDNILHRLLYVITNVRNQRVNVATDVP